MCIPWLGSFRTVALGLFFKPKREIIHGTTESELAKLLLWTLPPTSFSVSHVAFTPTKRYKLFFFFRFLSPAGLGIRFHGVDFLFQLTSLPSPLGDFFFSLLR